MSISNFEDKLYTKDQGAIQLSTLGSFADGMNYGTGYVEFAISQGGDSGDFLSLSSASDPTADGAISIDGGLVYLGTGAGIVQIGSVDGVNNGEAGKPLRINFDNVTVDGNSPVLNGDFSNGLMGWTAVLSPVDLGVTKIAGWATPEAPLVEYPTYTPGGDDGDLVSGFDAPQVFVNEDGRLQLQELNLTSTAFGVVHGPAAYSDVFHASRGMVLIYDWTADLINDDYHVVGYLLNSDTGAITIAAQGWDASGTGIAKVAVPSDGNYRFVFVSGSYDATGGTVLGASMSIDNIHVERPAVTDLVVQALSHQVVYQNTSGDQDVTKTVTVSAQDFSGAVASDDFLLNLTHVNNAPIASADTGRATEDGGPVMVDVLANDHDPDAGDSLAIVSTASSGMVGAVSIVGGKIAYDPGAHFQSLGAGATTTESFTYTITDSGGLTAAASVTMTIVGANDAPVAQADSASVEEKQTVTIDVLANDTDVDAGDVLSIASVDSKSALGGSIAIVDGKLKYTASGDSFDVLTLGQSVTDSFRYTVKDASGATSSATVTVKVNGAADGVIHGTVHFDTLTGTGGDEYIYGDNGEDVLYGLGGSDHLFGENGKDILDGGDGRDFLDGGNGKDVLIGGKGSDFLTGGEGNDVFVFGKEGVSSDVDVITDFNLDNDTVQLRDGLTVTSLVKVDYNHDGVMDTELTLSNGSHVELLGVSTVTNPLVLMLQH